MFDKLPGLQPVMNIPDDAVPAPSLDGTRLQWIAELLKEGRWAVGGYLDRRDGMYIAPQYRNERNIHMGIDVWAPAGEPVYSPLDGVLRYQYDHSEAGNYGPAMVAGYNLPGEKKIFVLFGHLSRASLKRHNIEEKLSAGQLIGWIGTQDENGGWLPHLHLQVSTKDPGLADMPGVIRAHELEKAKKLYPDPSFLLPGTGLIS